MSQLEFPEFPKAETRHIEPVIFTPPRQVLLLSIWERDDEPDFVVCRVESRDGEGRLLGLVQSTAARNEGWCDALDWLRRQAQEMWYESHSPFG